MGPVRASYADTGDGTSHPPTSPTATTTSGSPEAIVVSSPDGSHHEIHHSGNQYKGHWDCHYYEVGGTGASDIDILDERPPISPAPGQLVGLVCIDDAGNQPFREWFVYNPANPFGPLEQPERAADEARKLLPLDPPAVNTSPPATATQLVGLPTWFWIADPWEPLQASATLDTVTSTVIATPTTLSFTLDDGTSFSCDAPGTPYDTTRDPAGQHSTCTHTVERNGHATVTATVTDAVHWTATIGPGGDLDDLTRATTIPLTIQEAQALIN